MAKVLVFNSVSLDGYFTDAKGDMSFAKGAPDDAEWNAFVGGNASGDGVLLFGRITYEMMASFWTTPAAKEMMPEVAAGMSRMKKVVFSRTLREVSWENATLAKGDLVAETRKLKAGARDITILGSGTIVSQLTQARLIDEYQLVVVPVVLGSGRTMFEGVEDRLELKQKHARPFKNGHVLLSYVR